MTPALQDAAAFFGTLLLPQGLGVRLSSAAFISLITAITNYAGLGFQISEFCRYLPFELPITSIRSSTTQLARAS